MTGWQKDGGAGASAGGRGGSGATGGSGGSGATGGTGGSSATGGSGGSGATGGGGTGGTTGRGGSGGTGGSGGGGAAGRGGTGGGGTGGGGTGGSSADAGACASTVDWMSGGTYSMGDKVRGVCSTASSGAGSSCTVGKTYTWTCSLAIACGLVGPGTANWGLAWAVGAECN